MDRFPMASPEAKALMGSWRDEAESNWSSMKMSFSQRMGFEVRCDASASLRKSLVSDTDGGWVNVDGPMG